MIYVDAARPLGWSKGPSCHMMTDGTLDELHEFARRLGLRESWFQPKSSPHYDLTVTVRNRAVAMGAVEADRHKVVELIQLWRARAAEVQP